MWNVVNVWGVVIDFGGDVRKIFMVVYENKVIIEKVLIMYGYMDYVGVVVFIVEQFNVLIEGFYKEDFFFIEKLEEQGVCYGIVGVKVFELNCWFEDGD